MTLLEFCAFGWKYSGTFFRKRKPSQLKQIKHISYVTHKNTENWILGSKARRLAQHSKYNASISYTTNYRDLLVADGYFFLHPNIFAKSLQKNKNILDQRNIVMFTHPVFKNRLSIKHRAYVLNKADKVIFLNNKHAQLMLDNGLDKTKTEVMHLAADADMFQPHIRNKGKVCLCMAYYDRKNPDLMLNIIKGMPHRTFMLIGPQWEKYPEYKELHALPNFEHYEEPDYEDYPRLYAQCDVFLSTSKLEGGPVPLLETMLCNMVPVVSKTGYCEDIVNHGENGFLFDITATASEVTPLIELAYTLQSNTRESVINFTWEKYSEKIDGLFHDAV